MKMTADLSPNGKRIWVRFPYHEGMVRRAKRVSGASFVGADKGGPAWSYPLDLKTGKTLRETFGLGLKFSPELIEWGRKLKREERRLRNLSRARTATLKVIPEANPALDAFLGGRPYQRADVALMSTHSCINANDMGLGKSTEVIASAFEAGIERGRNLVIAPVTSLSSVWIEEICRWIPEEYILSGETPRDRKLAIEAANRRAADGKPFWLILNPDFTRFKRDKDDPKKVEPVNPLLFGIEFDSVTIDEYHKMGLSNPSSLGAIGANRLRARYRWALSGTPISGKPINLWGALHWVAPDRFPSRWQWANEWLEVTKNGFGHEYGDIKRGREDEFYAYHAPFLIRRTKAEEFPDLPGKIYNDVWVRMGKKQAEEYETFQENAEIRIDGERLVGLSVLAEYAHLKMMATARCRVERPDRKAPPILLPTDASPKLPALRERLERHAVGEKGGEAALVFTQSARYARVVHSWLSKNYKAGLITGDVDQTERATLVADFRAGRIDLLVIVTAAGGTSLNLQRADSVHIMDETWNPDDQAQAIDRADRGSRTKPLIVYTYRSRDTIEETIAIECAGKHITSKNILDLRRRGWR